MTRELGDSMSEEDAVRIAESHPGLQAVITSGVIAIMHIDSCAKIDRYGLPLTMLVRNGTSISRISNGND